jgi:hypothetical protein
MIRSHGANPTPDGIFGKDSPSGEGGVVQALADAGHERGKSIRFKNAAAEGAAQPRLATLLKELLSVNCGMDWGQAALHSGAEQTFVEAKKNQGSNSKLIGRRP